MGIDEDQDSAFNSYILFLDNTMNAAVLYVSPSVKENIGWDPDEIIGISSLAFVTSEDREKVWKLIMSNIRDAPIARFTQLKIKHKDSKQGQDGFVFVDFMINNCYDSLILIGCRSDHTRRSLAWRSSANDVVTFPGDGKVSVDNWNDRNGLKERLEQDQEFDWENVMPRSEPRMGLILNRFTSDLVILFSSLGSQLVVGLNACQITGKPLYDFISPDDIEMVKRIVVHVKESQQICRVSFKWISSHDADPIKCEAVLTYTGDGIVCIIRKSETT